MIPVNSKSPILLLLVLCASLGCSTFSRLTNKSGTIYTVEIETGEPDKNAVVERAVVVFRNKINAVGLDGEVSRANDKPNQISVKVYGAKDPERVRKFLFTTYQLELKRVAGSFFQTFPTPDAARVYAGQDQEILSFSEYGASAPEKFIVVDKKAVINGEDVRDAEAFTASEGDGDYKIMFTLNQEGAVKFGDWTGKNIGKYIAIVLDKKVISAPVIRGQIFDTGQIEGKFTRETAEDIALSMKSGYLPATVKLLEEKPLN